MAESVLVSTLTVFAGSPGEAEVTGFGLDMATATLVPTTAAKTAAPVSIHVFRFTSLAPAVRPRRYGGGCRSPSEAPDRRRLRLAGVHRLLQLRRARPEAGVVYFTARERRVREVRHSVGADALGPGQ